MMHNQKFLQSFVALFICAVLWSPQVNASESDGAEKRAPSFECEDATWKRLEDLPGNDFDRGFSWNGITEYTAPVHAFSKDWNYFVVTHEGNPIARGLRRGDKLEFSRGETVSELVSYDNEYPAVEGLTNTLGEPGRKEVRTEEAYETELRKPLLRLQRSRDWDLLGERWYWHDECGLLEYSVRFDLRGVRDHRVLQIREGEGEVFFDFLMARQFEEAKTSIIQRFNKSVERVIEGLFPEESKEQRPEILLKEQIEREPESRTQTIHDCQFDDGSCRMELYTYLGIMYRFDFKIIESGMIGDARRGHEDEMSVELYRRYLQVFEKLKGSIGEPIYSTNETDLDNPRVVRKLQRIGDGQEAFWSIWYEPTSDLYVRHYIVGRENGGTWEYRQQLEVRRHSVSRVMALKERWDRLVHLLSTKALKDEVLE